MKAIISIGYRHFLVSPAIAVAFLTEAEQINRDYDDRSNKFVYTKTAPDEAERIEVLAVDEALVGPVKQAPEVDKS